MADVNLKARWLVLRDTKNDTDRGVPIHRFIGLPPSVKNTACCFVAAEGPYEYLNRLNRNREEGGQCKCAWTLGVDGLASKIASA
jgi:hypothetical protein